jgi:NADH-quinone oxidoreductase subunit D
MENIISHFKYWTEGLNIKKNIIHSIIESPKGEYLLILISDNSNKPYRCKITSPSYFHLQFLKNLIKSNSIADLVTLIGSIDIVFGEIDR